MKPHEQEWRKDIYRTGVIRVGEHLSLDVRVDVGALMTNEVEMIQQVEALVGVVLALPDMARVLLEVRAAILSGTLSEDAPDVIERALRKAGVL